MRKIKITALFCVSLLTATPPADAQKAFSLSHFADSVLMVRYWRANIDTNYVTRPQTKWTLTGRFNVSGSTISAEGKAHGKYFETRLSADKKATVSVGVNYLGLGLNLSINPAKILGKYSDYELGFRSYGKRVGFDITYQDAHNYKGWTEVDGARQDVTTSEDLFRLKTANLNAYYVFNAHRFSYPAAFVSSYIQRRSAGSFLLAASAMWQKGEIKGEGSGVTEGRKPIDYKMTHIGIGGGYGYNYVPAQGWLLHHSALPTLIVYSSSTFTEGDNKLSLHYRFPWLIVTARSAIVKQIGSNKFAGLSVVYNFTGVGNRDNLSIHHQKWLARVNFGLRL